MRCTCLQSREKSKLFCLYFVYILWYCPTWWAASNQIMFRVESTWEQWILTKQPGPDARCYQPVSLSLCSGDWWPGRAGRAGWAGWGGSSALTQHQTHHFTELQSSIQVVTAPTLVFCSDLLILPGYQTSDSASSSNFHHFQNQAGVC